MRVKERLVSIKLINKAKEYPNYLSEIGVQAEMKKVRIRPEMITFKNRINMGNAVPLIDELKQ